MSCSSVSIIQYHECFCAFTYLYGLEYVGEFEEVKFDFYSELRL